MSSRLDFPLTKADLNNMITANKVIYYVDFNTEPDGEHVKIYSEYGIDFQLTGNFIYQSN